MDHALRLRSTDRLDRQIGVLKAQAVGCDQIQWKPVGRQLFQRQLTGEKIVATRTFDGDVLIGNLRQREIRKFRDLTLHQ